MDFAKFLSSSLADAGPAARQEFYKRSETLISERFASRGASEDQVAAALAGLRAARDAYELDRRAKEIDPPALAPVEPARQEQPRISKVQEPVVSSGASPGGGRLKLAGIALAAGIVIGFLGSGMFGGKSTSASMPETPGALQQAFETQKPVFDRNVALIRQIETALNRHRESTGSYPQGDAFEYMTSGKVQWPSEIGTIIAENRALAGKLLYRGQGGNFKLLAYLTGDCFVASVVSPAMVDPWRRFGPVDCTHFGVWTKDAERW